MATIISPMPQRPSQLRLMLMKRPSTTANVSSTTSLRLSDLVITAPDGTETNINAAADLLVRPFSANDGIQPLPQLRIDATEAFMRLSEPDLAAEVEPPLQQTDSSDKLADRIQRLSTASTVVQIDKEDAYADLMEIMLHSGKSSSSLSTTIGPGSSAVTASTRPHVADFDSQVIEQHVAASARKNGRALKLTLQVPTQPDCMSAESPLASPISRTSTKNPVAVNFPGTPMLMQSTASLSGSSYANLSSPTLTLHTPSPPIVRQRPGRLQIHATAESARSLLMQPREPVSAYPTNESSSTLFSFGSGGGIGSAGLNEFSNQSFAVQSTADSSAATDEANDTVRMMSDVMDAGELLLSHRRYGSRSRSMSVGNPAMDLYSLHHSGQ